jgi:hypothetical protein
VINGNGQTPVTAPVSVEDAVRRAIRDPEQRKAFRAKYPAYDTAKLREEMLKCDADVLAFEEAIVKAQRYKRECEDLIKQCEKRDVALKALSQSSA